MLRRFARPARVGDGGTRRTRLRRESESIAYVSILGPVPASRSSSNRWNQQNAVTFLEGAGFAAEEADVFFVEVDVEELADLALVVADVTAEIGEARGEFVEGFGDGGGATVYFWRAVGEAAEGGGDFDGHWHWSFSSFNFKIIEFVAVISLVTELRLEIWRSGRGKPRPLRQIYTFACAFTLSRLT